jgi:hypothetical protein
MDYGYACSSTRFGDVSVRLFPTGNDSATEYLTTGREPVIAIAFNVVGVLDVWKRKKFIRLAAERPPALALLPREQFDLAATAQLVHNFYIDNLSAFGQNGALAGLKSAAEKGWERSWAKLVGIYGVCVSCQFMIG